MGFHENSRAVFKNWADPSCVEEFEGNRVRPPEEAGNGFESLRSF